MKSSLKSILAGVILLSALNANAAILTYNANPTLKGNVATATNFTFNLFDSNLGTLTAVDLLFNSSTAGGSVSINTIISDEDATFSNLTASVRTSGTGLTNQNTTPVGITFSPSLPYLQSAGTNQSYSATGSQSLISSVLTYSINPANWASYQVAGGSGNTPNFTGRILTNFTISSGVLPSTDNSLFTGASSYSLRYTYTPSGPVPVPEPGQVAASLLLLSGIGAYVFLKRRKKPATTTA